MCTRGVQLPGGVQQSPVVGTCDRMWPDAEVQVFPVQPIEPSAIVDTIGAGDSFAGGVSIGTIGEPLTRFVQMLNSIQKQLHDGCAPEELDFVHCVHLGSLASRYTIQQQGASHHVA